VLSGRQQPAPRPEQASHETITPLRC
jgi:hypothetical protein